MNNEHRTALQASLHDICRDLDAEDILPYLLAKGVIQDGQAQEIMKTARKSTKNMQLIYFIKGAGSLAFQGFIDALQACNKEHLAEIILANLPSSTRQLTLLELANQAPSTSSSTMSQSNTTDWQQQLETAQQPLKEMYLTRFQKVYPFSLPFTFDIEKTWVSLALTEYNKELDAADYFTRRLNRFIRALENDMKYLETTEDHAELLKKAFDKVKMLIIEGDPATGKTSLMRRLAYEWAKGKQDLLHYDLVLYAEFREVREKTFETIADLVLGGLEKYLPKEGYENLKKLVNNERFCKKYCILVLLDGYDESSLEKQCSEFSAFIEEKTINKQLFFNTVITTRKGYLSHLRGREGRFVFAEVLGFTTKQQKEKYIFSHFRSSEIDNIHNIAAVHHLLDNNENLNKLAETPLFLTFICLVHERIVHGTLIELYCNIIWWLIDRHQQDFPDRDVPALFEFRSDYAQASETLNIRQKQNIIQNNYLQFPQLLGLGKMALNNVKKDIFQETDFTVFSIQPIIHHVGLIRKDELYDQSWNLTSTYSFPHRTIQEFLAAFYCFCSNDRTSEWLLPNYKLDTLNEFERFLLRIALSDKMPIQTEKREYYFERITDIDLDMTFDAFNTTTGFNNKLLNWFFSKCTTVIVITLTGQMKSARHESNMMNDTSVPIESAITSKMPNPLLFSCGNLIKLHSLTFIICTFLASSQLSFTNCPSLKYLTFKYCEMKSSSIVNFATLLAIDTVTFYRCNIDLATWQSITDQISNSSVKCLQLTFGMFLIGNGVDFNKEFLIHLQNCNNVEQMEITIQGHTIRQNDPLSFNHLIKLHSLTFGGGLSSEGCTFSASSQLSFTNFPSLKNLRFRHCTIESNTNLGIATLPAIDTVHFDECTIDLATWQSLTDQISNSNVKYLQLSADFFVKESYPEFLHHLHKCERIQQIHVNDILGNKFLKQYEDSVTANLALTAQQLPALTSITILDSDGKTMDERWRLSERNRELVEKAGQQRNPHFSIKYVKDSDPRQPQPVKSRKSKKCNII